MICKNCGENNELTAKFCVKCGTALEEVKVEETKVEEVAPVQSEPIAVAPTNLDKEAQAKKDNKAVIIVLSIFGGLILLGIIAYLTIPLLIGMFTVKAAKTIENGVREEIKNTESIYGTKDQMFPDFKYVMPTELEAESYNSKSLGFFKNKDSSNLCSMTLWNISYVASDATAESVMQSHSSIGTIKELKPTTTKINGKTWTTYVYSINYAKKTEYGRFSNDGKSFYLIKYIDYKPATGVCDKYLNNFLKTLKSK